MIGKTLGGYRIVEQIGMGGMATVYKAYDANTDRYVALKTLPQQYSQNPEFVERFRREARAIAKLEHIHILPVHAFGEDDGLAYLVMRYLAAGTLSERIQQVGQMPLDTTARIITQVAQALDYAHENGILHRDVKPSNVLIDAQDNTYLTDFGIARIVEGTIDLTGDAILGTPQYMSPEQSQGRKDLTAATDQYSLGVVLYEMVTGRTPFQAETPLAIIHMHMLGADLPLPSTLRTDIPEAVERVILKALVREPESRYPSCSAMAKALTQASADQPTVRMPAGANAAPPTASPAVPPAVPASESGATAQITTPVNNVESPVPNPQPTTGLGTPTAANAPATATVTTTQPLPRIVIIGAISGIVALVLLVLIIVALSSRTREIANNGGIPNTGSDPGSEVAASGTLAPEVAPTFDVLAATAVHLADIYEPAAALDALDEALALYPDDAQLLALRAEMHLAEGEGDAALEAIDRAIELEPENPDFYVARGIAFRDFGEYTDAMDDFNAAIALENPPAAAYRERGTLRSWNGNIDGAIEDYDTAIEINPEYGYVYLDRGFAHFFNEDYEEAIADFEQVAELEPSEAWAYGGIAQVLIERGDLDGALEAVEQAIDIAPNDLDLRLLYGRVLRGNGNYEEAIAQYEFVIDEDMEYPEPYIERARTLLLMADYEGAVADYQRVLELSPNLDLDFAIDDFIEYTPESESRGFAMMILVQALTDNGNYVEAQRVLEAFVASVERQDLPPRLRQRLATVRDNLQERIAEEETNTAPESPDDE